MTVRAICIVEVFDNSSAMASVSDAVVYCRDYDERFRAVYFYTRVQSAQPTDVCFLIQWMGL